MVEATERCSLAAASFSSCLMSADVRIDTVSSFSRLIVTLRKPFCAANVRQLPYAKIVPGDRRGQDWRHGFRRRQRSSWGCIEKACEARASRRFPSLIPFSGYTSRYTRPPKARGMQISSRTFPQNFLSSSHDSATGRWASGYDQISVQPRPRCVLPIAHSTTTMPASQRLLSLSIRAPALAVGHIPVI